MAKILVLIMTQLRNFARCSETLYLMHKSDVKWGSMSVGYTTYLRVCVSVGSWYLGSRTLPKAYQTRLTGIGSETLHRASFYMRPKS